MMPLQESEPVGIYDKDLSVVLGDDVEDDARHDEQEPRDDEHDRTDERGESFYWTTVSVRCVESTYVEVARFMNIAASDGEC